MFEFENNAKRSYGWGQNIKRRLLHIKAAPVTQAPARPGSSVAQPTELRSPNVLELRVQVNAARPGQLPGPGEEERPGRAELQLRLLSGLRWCWVRPPHCQERRPGRVTEEATQCTQHQASAGTQSWPRTADTQLSFPAVTRLSNTHSMSLHNKIYTVETDMNQTFFICLIIFSIVHLNIYVEKVSSQTHLRSVEGVVQAICTFISCAFCSHMCPCLSLVITMWPQSLVSSSEAAEAALATGRAGY